jgi:hypothetical protein
MGFRERERERERELTARAGGKPLRTSPSPPVLLQGATSADTNTMFIILQTGMMALWAAALLGNAAGVRRVLNLRFHLLSCGFMPPISCRRRRRRCRPPTNVVVRNPWKLTAMRRRSWRTRRSQSWCMIVCVFVLLHLGFTLQGSTHVVAPVAAADSDPEPNHHTRGPTATTAMRALALYAWSKNTNPNCSRLIFSRTQLFLTDLSSNPNVLDWSFLEPNSSPLIFPRTQFFPTDFSSNPILPDWSYLQPNSSQLILPPTQFFPTEYSSNPILSDWFFFFSNPILPDWLEHQIQCRFFFPHTNKNGIQKHRGKK